MSDHTPDDLPNLDSPPPYGMMEWAEAEAVPASAQHIPQPHHSGNGNALCDEALAYARQGWSVFPLVPGEKRPLSDHGFKDATIDEAQIRRWWTKYPHAGIGLATGEVSGIVVLDSDPRNGGDASLQALVEQHGDLPDTPQAITGSGGLHAFFRYPEDGLGSRPNLSPGLDFKSDGGYVVLPPSFHPNGNAYAWALGKSPQDIEPARLPEWLSTLVRTPATEATDPTSERRVLSDGEVRFLAALLRPHWKPSVRHELAKGLAGYFAMQGTGRADAEALTDALTDEDEERKDRFIAVRDTWRRARDGQPVTGWTTLVSILGQETAHAVADIVKRAVQGEGAVRALEASVPKFVVRTLEDRRMNRLSIPEPLIEHIVWQKTLAMLFGPTGVFKSTYLVQLGLAAARGRYSAGRTMKDLVANTDLPAIVRPMRVFYVGPEDSPEMFEAMKLTDDVMEAFKDVPGGQFLYMNRRITLAARNPQDVELGPFIDEVLSAGKNGAGPIDLVILDPLKRFHTLDENDNSAMDEVMKAIDTIRTETGAAVIFSHHTGKQASRTLTTILRNREDPTQARGAGVLSDQSNVVMSLVKGRGKTIVLSFAKSNYAPHRPSVVFERHESGLLVPVSKSDSQLMLVAEILESHEGRMLRSGLVKELARRKKVSSRHAGRLVGRAEETRLIRRSDAHGELHDSGDYVALPEDESEAPIGDAGATGYKGVTTD
jgi:RecA-family ATPase